MADRFDEVREAGEGADPSEPGSFDAERLEIIAKLVPGLVHELRSPMQIISDNLHFLESAFSAVEELLSAPAEEWAERAASRKVAYSRAQVPDAIEASVDGLQRVASVASTLIALGQPQTPEPASVRLNPLITNAVTMCRNEWKYVADVDLDLEEELAPIRGYAAELSHVILSLLMNAAYYTVLDAGDEGQRGKLTISTRSLEDAVELRVSETGIPAAGGASAADRPADRNQRRLDRVRYIVREQHGGKLDRTTRTDGCREILIRLPRERPGA